MNKYLLQVLELAHNGIGKLMIETFNTDQQCHWRSWVGPKNFKKICLYSFIRNENPETNMVYQTEKCKTAFTEEEESEEGGEQDLMHVLGNMVMALMVKYWIYICGSMFFIVTFEGRIVMYKIIYMMMFLSCVALYQVRTERTPSD